MIVPEADRTELECLVRRRNTWQKVVLRARVVLLIGSGASTSAIMEVLGTSDADDHVRAQSLRDGAHAGFAARCRAAGAQNRG